jgi:hypothetical protein
MQVQNVQIWETKTTAKMISWIYYTEQGHYGVLSHVNSFVFLNFTDYVSPYMYPITNHIHVISLAEKWLS